MLYVSLCLWILPLSSWLASPSTPLPTTQPSQRFSLAPLVAILFAYVLLVTTNITINK
jgi:hypothetical protein